MRRAAFTKRLGPYAWRLPGPGGVGPARPSPYSPRLLELMHQAATRSGIPLWPGIYAQVSGPSYETPAEIRALRAWSADAVGMSTAREAQIAYDLGMDCAALSGITNRAAGLGSGPIHHEEVLIVGKQLGDKTARLLGMFLTMLE